jgi:hypothetical protein
MVGVGLGCCCGDDPPPEECPDCCTPTEIRIWVQSPALDHECYLCDECNTEPHQLVLTVAACPEGDALDFYNEFWDMDDATCGEWISGAPPDEQDLCFDAMWDCVIQCYEVSYTEPCRSCARDVGFCGEDPSAASVSTYYEHTWKAVLFGDITTQNCKLYLVHFYKLYRIVNDENCTGATLVSINKILWSVGLETDCCGDLKDPILDPYEGGCTRFCSGGGSSPFEWVCPAEGFALASPGHPEYEQVELVC